MHGTKRVYKRVAAPRSRYGARRSRKAVLNRNFAVEGMGFPKKMLMTHKYFESFDMSSSAGSTGIYQFCCNGLFDPNYTGAGHQPMYFDQCTAVYNHYTVIGAKMTATFSPAAAANTNTIVGAYINDDATVTPTIFGLIEQNKAKYGVMTTTQNFPTRVSQRWSAKKWFGGSIIGNPNMRGDASNNPVEASFFTLFAFPQNLSATQTYNVQIVIEYITIWTEIKDLISS